ncbi:MAG: alpha/beta fold hydrolase [Lautropia sp.]|nr:alpha/beta fold hydrolase [Lautropia sp.]
MQAFEIRPATEADLPAMLAIFNDLVLHSDAVYTEVPATFEERRAWFQSRTGAGFPVLVADRDGEVLGVASFGPFRDAWPGYRHTVEHSVHVRRDQYRQGVGRALMEALLQAARQRSLHMMIGVVDAANVGSLRLHEQLGFRRVGHLPQVGWKAGRWLDVVLVQRPLQALEASTASGLPAAEGEAGLFETMAGGQDVASKPEGVSATAQGVSSAVHVSPRAVVSRSRHTRLGALHLKYWPAPSGASRWPTVVLFHGLFGDSDVWAATALNLNRAGLNVLAVDLPGHGASQVSATTMAAVVESVKEALLAEAWPSLVLVGHSFGAVVATRLAADADLPVAGLALLSPAGMGREVNSTFLEAVMAATDEKMLADALSYVTVKHQRASSHYLRQMLTRIEAAKVQLRALIDEAVGPDDGLQQNSIREVLPSLHCPVVIIQGREDGVMPWRHVLNAPSQVGLHLLSDVGHMPHWEATALTQRILLQLIRGIGQSPAC